MGPSFYFFLLLFSSLPFPFIFPVFFFPLFLFFPYSFFFSSRFFLPFLSDFPLFFAIDLNFLLGILYVVEILQPLKEESCYYNCGNMFYNVFPPLPFPFVLKQDQKVI